jgi:hypothetical protein
VTGQVRQIISAYHKSPDDEASGVIERHHTATHGTGENTSYDTCVISVQLEGEEERDKEERGGEDRWG